MSVLTTYFSPGAIKLAYYRVQCWSDKTVKDQVGLKAFGANLDDNAKHLSNKIISGEYSPQKGFKFYMPKPSKTLRTKTRLRVEDALVYQAIANKIAENNQPKLAELEDFVFGSVLTADVVKGTSIMLEGEPNYFFYKFWKGLFHKFKVSVLQSIEKDKVKYKFETDITGFFDSIPHYNLLMVLSNQFNVEDEILDLLSDCFNVWSGTKESMTPGVGIPQGNVPSFLFANLILHQLDDQIIRGGYKYYRYMDDIHIYGYEESEMIEALLIVDKYTKGNGLSINAKKTSILEIDQNNEEELVKREIKTLSAYALYEVDIEMYDDTFFVEESGDLLEKPPTNISDVLEKDVNRLSEQDQGSSAFLFNSKLDTLTDENDIKDFWKEKFNEVEVQLKDLFINPDADLDHLVTKEGVEDIDFIKLGSQYTSSQRSLYELGLNVDLDIELVKYWLYAYKKYFWRANNLGITLGAYGDNDDIKRALIRMYNESFKPYEWVRYYIVMTLSFHHSFDDMELRKLFFKWLREEDSDLAKISLYRLLFKHSKSKQFIASLKKELQRETSVELKLMITDFNRSVHQKEIDMAEFINTIGL